MKCTRTAIVYYIIITKIPKVICERAAMPQTEFAKLPIGYNGAPYIRLQNYLVFFLSTDFQTQLPVSSVDLSNLPSQTASISDEPFLPQCTGQTNR